MHRAARLWVPVLSALLVLSACGLGSASDGASAFAAPTPDIETPGLLPPVTPNATAPTADGSATDAEPLTLEPAATPTPRPPTLSCLTQRSRFAQLLMPLVDPAGVAAASEHASAGELGALALLGSPGQALAGQLQAIQQASFVPIMIASDEEGGSVQRLADLLGPLPSAASMATTRTPQDVQAQWLEYGARAKALGIDVILGPVVDVGGAPGIGSRSFGEDDVIVTAYARAVVDGLSEAGITPVLKHFPGHGRASGDSHLGLPVVPALDQLWASDLQPYVAIVGDHKRDEIGVMIGHLSVPGLTTDLPTSLSPEAINGLLRNDIGFGGLVFSDALNMGAIVERYGPLQAIDLALIAGTDIVILGSLAELGPALDHLEARASADVAFAALLESRVGRVMAAKGQTLICAGAQ